MAPELVRTCSRTRGIPEDSSKQLPENLNPLEKEKAPQEHCANGLRDVQNEIVVFGKC